MTATAPAKTAAIIDPLMAKLIEAPEGHCVSGDWLTEAAGNKTCMCQALRALREKLKPARATIEMVRGDGYRLINLE
jgi:hypothetical protein